VQKAKPSPGSSPVQEEAVVHVSIYGGIHGTVHVYMRSTAYIDRQKKGNVRHQKRYKHIEIEKHIFMTYGSRPSMTFLEDIMRRLSRQLSKVLVLLVSNHALRAISLTSHLFDLPRWPRQLKASRKLAASHGAPDSSTRKQSCLLALSTLSIAAFPPAAAAAVLLHFLFLLLLAAVAVLLGSYEVAPRLLVLSLLLLQLGAEDSTMLPCSLWLLVA